MGVSQHLWGCMGWPWWRWWSSCILRRSWGLGSCWHGSWQQSLSVSTATRAEPDSPRAWSSSQEHWPEGPPGTPSLPWGVRALASSSAQDSCFLPLCQSWSLAEPGAGARCSSERAGPPWAWPLLASDAGPAASPTSGHTSRGSWLLAGLQARGPGDWAGTSYGSSSLFRHTFGSSDPPPKCSFSQSCYWELLGGDGCKLLNYSIFASEVFSEGRQTLGGGFQSWWDSRMAYLTAREAARKWMVVAFWWGRWCLTPQILIYSFSLICSFVCSSIRPFIYLFIYLFREQAGCPSVLISASLTLPHLCY